MGRHCQRKSFVGVRFLPEEKQILQEMALRQGMTLSHLVRLAALGCLEKAGRKSVPEVNRKIYFELGRISGQLQRVEPSPASLLDLRRLLDEVRRELLGLESSFSDNS